MLHHTSKTQKVDALLTSHDFYKWHQPVAKFRVGLTILREAATSPLPPLHDHGTPRYVHASFVQHTKKTTTKRTTPPALFVDRRPSRTRWPLQCASSAPSPCPPTRPAFREHPPGRLRPPPAPPSCLPSIFRGCCWPRLHLGRA